MIAKFGFALGRLRKIENRFPSPNDMKPDETNDSETCALIVSFLNRKWNIAMTPKDLDAQNTIKIDEWVDIDSDRWREVDDNPSFTKKIIRLGFEEPPFLTADSLGRLWGKSKSDGRYFPFHLEYGKKLIGFRISAKAAN